MELPNDAKLYMGDGNVQQAYSQGEHYHKCHYCGWCQGFPVVKSISGGYVYQCKPASHALNAVTKTK